MGKHPEQLKAIGDQVRSVRRAKGFSQEGFALAAGLDRSYYGKVERGEVNPAITTFVRIAQALGCEVGDLVPPVKDLRG